ncbi:MAG TPA: hypothetical protein VEC99_00970, partial [Clostridia bacterium]|nr:hypothetical protein [Clostridia bacterium]
AATHTTVIAAMGIMAVEASRIVISLGTITVGTIVNRSPDEEARSTMEAVMLAGQDHLRAAGPVSAHLPGSTGVARGPEPDMLGDSVAALWADVKG